jgi:hypothetical protein
VLSRPETAAASGRLGPPRSILSGENTGTPTAYYVGTYGRLRTVTKVPGVDQFWLSTTNCDNNGVAPNGSDRILRVTVT